jgi:hypothetical protein
MTTLLQSPRRRARSPKKLLKSGEHNRKLGAGIWQFSIPAKKTCPGKTAICALVCYVGKGMTAMPSRQKEYRQAHRFSLTEDFVPAMIAFIAKHDVRMIRIHVSGDFYSAEYAEKWLRIAMACPQVGIYTYTRSWREADILPVLQRLAARPNVQLFFSEDRETGRSPRVRGVLRAFMLVDKGDEDFVDRRRHDLVFRDRKHRSLTLYDRQLKRVNDVLVCPAEQWYVWNPQHAHLRKQPPKIQCATCRWCFRDKLGRPRQQGPELVQIQLQPGLGPRRDDGRDDSPAGGGQGPAERVGPQRVAG